MRVSNTVANLLNGVSDQDPVLRKESQLQEQINMVSHPAYGLRRRPGTFYVGSYSKTPQGSWILSALDNTKYVFTVFTDKTFAAHRLNGTNTADEVPVTVRPESAVQISNYLPTDEKFLGGTIVDSRLLLWNKQKIVTMKGSASAQRQNKFFVWVRAGTYNQGYRITLRRGTTVVTWALTTTGSDRNGVLVENITNDLLRLWNLGDATNGNVGSRPVNPASAQVSIQRIENVLIITDNVPPIPGPSPNPNGDQLTVEVNDNAANQYLVVGGSYVRNFSDLPQYCENNFVTKVLGKTEDVSDDYWVRFAADGNQTLGAGVWVETVAPSVREFLDEGTLPVQVTFNQSGGLVVSTVDWQKREVGDDDSNPQPLFVNRPIQDVFLYRGRLGILCPDCVTWSRPNKYYDFWRTSAVKTLDDDPINILINHPRLSYMRWAVPFGERLVLLGDRAQFIVPEANTFTNSTVAVEYASGYDVGDRMRPFVADTSLYAANDKNIREFFIDPNTNKLEAVNVTAHVSSLFEQGTPAHPSVLVSQNTAAISLRTPEPLAATGVIPSFNVLVYRWLYEGSASKLQSSWSIWKIFGTTVYRVLATEDSFVFIHSAGIQTAAAISVMPFTDNVVRGAGGDGDGEVACLDLQYNPDPVLSATYGNGRYTPNLLYRFAGGSDIGTLRLLVRADNVLPDSNGTFPLVEGIGTPPQTAVGFPYESKITLSPLYMRKQSTRDAVPISVGKLQVNSVTMTFTNSSVIKVKVTPRPEEPNNYRETIYEINPSKGSDITLDPAYRPVEITVPVMADGARAKIELSDNSTFSFGMSSIHWTGNYQTNSRPI